MPPPGRWQPLLCPPPFQVTSNALALPVGDPLLATPSEARLPLLSAGPLFSGSGLTVSLTCLWVPRGHHLTKCHVNGISPGSGDSVTLVSASSVVTSVCHFYISAGDDG